MTRVYPGGLTPEEALARMIELTESIARCQRLNIVEMIPDLEGERTSLRNQYMKLVHDASPLISKQTA